MELTYGLPVIGTKAGAIPETVPDGAGMLVPAGDAAGIVGSSATGHQPIPACGCRMSEAAVCGGAATAQLGAIRRDFCRRFGEAGVSRFSHRVADAPGTL